MPIDLKGDARDEIRKALRSEIRTRKSAETRKRIVDTTSELISERGNTVFKMSEVSRRCNMSKGALYYYFSDKQDLVNAVFEEEVDDLMKVLDRCAIDAGSGVEALRHMCDEFVERVSRGGVLAMALVRELAFTREPGSYAQNDRVRHIVELIAAQLEQCKRDGIVRLDFDTHLAAVAVCGMFTFSAVSVSEASARAGVQPSTIADELFDMAVRGLDA